MFNFTNGFVLNDIFSVLVLAFLLIFLILFVVFIILQMKANKRTYNVMKDGLSNTQDAIFTKASEQLAKQLSVYTETTLIDKVNDSYAKLVSQDLLPAVNDAAVRITELSEGVSKQQEDGIRELAVMLANMMSDRMREYIDSEAIIVARLNESVNAFSSQLDSVAKTMHDITSMQDSANEQTKLTCMNVAQVSNLLSDRIIDLKDIMQSTTNSMTDIQTLVKQNSQIVLALVEKTSDVQLSFAESAKSITEQNVRTSQNINSAISSMQHSTEQAAKILVAEFSQALSGSTSSISGALDEMKNVAEKIDNSSLQLVSSIDKLYDGFGDNLSNHFNNIAANISESAIAEYQKVASLAESYSNAFANSINSFNSDLDNHIYNLKAVTEQLNSNISTYKDDVDTSSKNFEVGMEKSISAALSQIDSSLAEIVQRLVDVTINIQEAANVLPRGSSNSQF